MRHKNLEKEIAKFQLHNEKYPCVFSDQCHFWRGKKFKKPTIDLFKDGVNIVIDYDNYYFFKIYRVDVIKKKKLISKDFYYTTTGTLTRIKYLIKHI